jgi:hypothetical protein
VAFFVVAVAAPAIAGPPYLTDDPVPTDPGHWEIYNYIGGAKGPGGLDGETGVDLNYGPAKDLQVTAVFPVGFDNPHGYASSGFRTGGGVIELAGKYRFLHQDDHGSAPDVAFFPRFFVPTDHRYGSGHISLLLPIWAQKDLGPWSVFGGGGYTINPGSGNRDFWQGGIALSRSLSKRMTLGGELFAQGNDTTGGGGFTAVNVALTYKLVAHWSLLASAGPTFEHGGEHGQVFYLSLKADY